MTCSSCGLDEPTWAARLIESSPFKGLFASYCQCESRSLRSRPSLLDIERFSAGDPWPRVFRTETVTTTRILDYPYLPNHSSRCVDFARLVGKRTLSISTTVSAKENRRKTSREVKKETLVKKRLVSDSSPDSPPKHVKGSMPTRGPHITPDEAVTHGISASAQISSSPQPRSFENSSLKVDTADPTLRCSALPRSVPKLVVQKRPKVQAVNPTRNKRDTHERSLDQDLLRLTLVSAAHLAVHTQLTDIQGESKIRDDTTGTSEGPAIHVSHSPLGCEQKPGPAPPSSDFEPILSSPQKKHWPREWIARPKLEQDHSSEPAGWRPSSPRILSSPSPSLCAMMIPPSPIMYSRKSSVSKDDFALP